MNVKKMLIRILPTIYQLGKFYSANVCACKCAPIIWAGSSLSFFFLIGHSNFTKIKKAVYKTIIMLVMKRKKNCIKALYLKQEIEIT